MGRGAAGAGAHGGSSLASAEFPGSCAGPGGPAAGLAGARCEFGGRWGLPWGGSRPLPPPPPAPGSTRLPRGKSSGAHGPPPPSPAFSSPAAAKPELPEQEAAALAEGVRDALGMCPASCSAPCPRIPGRASPLTTPQFNLPWGCGPQGTLARPPGGQGGLCTPSGIRAGPSPPPGWPRAAGAPRPPPPPRHRAPGSLCPRTG